MRATKGKWLEEFSKCVECEKTIWVAYFDNRTGEGPLCNICASKGGMS